MERDLGGVIGDAATGTQTGGVGAGSPEIIEPEFEVEPAGVVFNESELRPAHRAVHPVRRRESGRLRPRHERGPAAAYGGPRARRRGGAPIDAGRGAGG